MVLPLIPILAVIALLSGGVTLAWYELLSDDEKEKANDFAANHAERLYQKTIAELTKDEARVIEHLTRKTFE